MPTSIEEGPSVIVVEDHQLFRQAITDLLREQGITVAGEAADAAEGVALASELKPDVALMDLNLPDATGIEATRRMRIVSPPTRILMLTVSAEESDVTDALQAGACGYLLKDAPAEEIVAATRAAAAGHSFLSPPVAAMLLERFRDSSAVADLPADDLPQLSGRELEVLSLLAGGKENAEIAESLVISPHTVKNHVSEILTKLRLENRIQAAVYAVRKGIV